MGKIARLTYTEEPVKIEDPKEADMEEIWIVEQIVNEKPNAFIQNPSTEEVENMAEVLADKGVTEKASSHEGSLFIT